MSDIYVFSSNDNTNDYTTMGLVGALTPTECTFKETANGESVVELTHPIDSFGRYTALQRGNILAVPVPVRTTPEIHNGQCVTTVWTYKVKPLNQLTSTAQRTLYMWRFSSAPKVAILNAGEEVTVIWKANDEEPASGQEDIHPWKVKSKYGEGWIDPDALELVTTHSIADDPTAIEEIQSPWTVTKQFFRIYEVQKGLDEIGVVARHISYDLLYNMTSYRNGSAATLQEILDGVLDDCYAEHQFSAYTTLEGSQPGNWYDQRNPIDIFLNADDGLCERFDVGLIRDNYSLYFLRNPGINRGVRIQYGKNLTGIDFFSSDDEVATRIVPVGEKEDGTKLYLNDEIAFPGVLKYNSRGNTVKELQSRLVQLGYSVGSTGIDGIFEWRTENGLNDFKEDAGLPTDGIYDEATHEALMEALGITSLPYIDSDRINDYPVIHVYELQCENCKVGQEEDGGGKVTEEIARARMKQQAEELLENGCDEPSIEMSVEFLNLGDTEEYKQFRNLENCFLFDYVIVQHPTMDIDVTAQILEFEWDCLLDRMVSVEIGSVTKTLANTGITSWQIPNGFSGSKIAGQSIEGGALQSDIISVRHMQANSINTDALQAQCVTAVKIAAGAIEANHISVEALDAITANIDWANIEWADIENLSATIAEISKAHLGDADIDWASIQNLTAVVANISKAHLTDADIDWADIENLNAVMASIVHQEVGVGEFGLAEIQNLLANALILEQGSAGSMTITNLIVTQANMLGAVIENLVLPGEDGKYYEVVVGTDGVLSTEEVSVTQEEIEAGELNDGRQIATTTVNAESINGTSITAQQAILNTVLTEALTAGQITAGQALIASATVPALYTTSIEAIGNSLTFSANEKIQFIIGDVDSLRTEVIVGANEEFYLSSSPTSLSGGEWSQTQPEWENGKYIWRRTLIQYGDGTSEYTPSEMGVCITGNTGAQGLQGLQGPQGEQGIPGQDGQTTYFHIKYSSVQNPTSASDMSETPSTYIGTYVDFNQADSDDPGAYTWSRFVGAQGVKGDQGIPGTNGSNGQTSYLHIAYANSADGSSGFSVSDSVNKLYIGQYTDFTQADSTDYTKYSWTKIKGETGTSGKGVSSITAEFYLSTSKTEQTGGSWTSVMPTWSEGFYLWTRNKIVYTNPSSTSYTEPVCDSSWEAANGAYDAATDAQDMATNAQNSASSALTSITEGLEEVRGLIIGTDEIKATIFNSSEYTVLASKVSQTASDVNFVIEETIEGDNSLDARLQTIEGTVRIGSGSVDLGRSDSTYQMHIDNDGLQILDGGNVTISAEQKKIRTPRVEVSEALMIGGLAWVPGDGHVRLVKYSV